MPFVQGHLRNESVAVDVDTECAHCSRPVQIAVDNDLRYHVPEAPGLLIFVPIVNFEKLEDPSIIHAF